MQQALSYRNWLTNTSAVSASGNSNSGGESAAVKIESEKVRKNVAENAVVVFARRGCCMCHVVKLLLHGHGVNPSIFDVDEKNEGEVIDELSKIIADSSINGVPAPVNFPAVFVGGKLFGGLEEVMAAHITGELVPRLREARALWL